MTEKKIDELVEQRVKERLFEVYSKAGKARVAKLGPAAVKAQCQKAIRVRWEKYRANKLSTAEGNRRKPKGFDG